MARKMKLDDCYLICGGCKKEYSLDELATAAGKQNKRNLYCPHCGKRVGTLN